MKTLSQELKKVQEGLKSADGKICHYVMSPWGDIKVEPFMSTDKKCDYCSGTEHYSPFRGDGTTNRAWLCANATCSVYEATKGLKPTHHITNEREPVVPPLKREIKRAVEWPYFCELNDIGNKKYGLTFESIKQPRDVVNDLLAFAKRPSEVFFFQGSPGTGKTYAALGICEYYTRQNPSCIFLTQEKMFEKWLETFNGDKTNKFIERVTNVSLLVIDDFGIGEVSDKFLRFFMNLINSRNDWDNRGTIITTNLDDDTFSGFCGEALIDRIRTGTKFIMNGESRR